jgi:cell division protein FtsQ
MLYDSHLFDVQGVQVEGVTTVQAADVLSAAAVPTGAPLASIDTAAVAARVAALPPVASAVVARAWPHTVTVTVVERVPVATATTPAGVQLVDGGGVVYPGAPPPGLPRLIFGAVGPDDPSTRSALAALATLPPPIRSQVLTVDATVAGANVPGQVTFGLTGGRRVVWGTDDRAADKAAVLVPLLTQPGHVFDVTSPDLPTIRR